MPDYGLTDITIIVDESGSMRQRADATIEGFNTFLEEQKETSLGRTRVTLIKFNTSARQQYEAVDIDSVPALDNGNYRPSGNTALLDAIGTGIHAAGQRIENAASHEQPGNVIFVVQTDGAENCSSQFNRESIAAMIRHQEEYYAWDFFFLAAGQDAIVSGGNMGFKAGKSLSYAGDPEAQRKAFLAASNATSQARSGTASGEDDFFGSDWRDDVS